MNTLSHGKALLYRYSYECGLIPGNPAAQHAPRRGFIKLGSGPPYNAVMYEFHNVTLMLFNFPLRLIRLQTLSLNQTSQPREDAYSETRTGRD